MHYNLNGIFFNMVIVWLIPITLLLVIALSIYMVNRNKKTKYQPTNSTSLKILNERFAKGEINEEEYMRMKKIVNKINGN